MPTLKASVMVLLAWEAVAAPPALAAQDDLAGTYELILCRSACGPGDVERHPERILLSLYGEPLFTTGALAGRQPKLYPMFLHLRDTPERANACFFLSHDPAGTFIGIRRQTITGWKANTAGTIAFPLYRSPDAGSEVDVRGTAEGLVGEVRDWSVMGWTAASRTQYVAARRVGPPDLRVCDIQPRSGGGT